MCLSLQRKQEDKPRNSGVGWLQGMGTEMNGRDVGGSDNSLSILFCIILTDESMLMFYILKIKLIK